VIRLLVKVEVAPSMNLVAVLLISLWVVLMVLWDAMQIASDGSREKIESRVKSYQRQAETLRH
jgi:hypothetical protein